MLDARSFVNRESSRDFNTRAEAASATISLAHVKYIRTAGYKTVGDGGAALYARGSGPSPCGFQSAEGGWWRLIAAPVNVRMCGATGKPLTDDAWALQAAIDYAEQGGPTAKIYWPAGNYHTTAALSITSQVTMTGDGLAMSILTPTTSVDGIDVNTLTPVTIEKMGIFYPSPAAAGTQGIFITATGGSGNSSSVIRDVQIIYPYVGVMSGASTAFVFDDLKVELFGSAAIVLQNTMNGDAGDSTITNSFFLGATLFPGGGELPLACLRWTSSDGLRFVNNKCLNVQYGIMAQLAVGLTGGQMVIGDNSFDGMSVSAISFSRLGSKGLWGRVSIANNMFNLTRVGVSVLLDPNGVWLTGLSIIGNQYYDAGSSENQFVNLNSLTNFIVGYNSSFASVPTTRNFVIGPTAIHGVIGPNIKIGDFSANHIAGTDITFIAPN